MQVLRRALASFGRAEFLLAWYGLTLAFLLVLHGQTVPGRTGWVLFHLAYLPAAWGLSRLDRPWLRIGILFAWVSTSFTTMGLYLPDLVPEPLQWQVLALNEAVGGGYVQRALSAPPAWLVEVCVICYSTFYFLPLGLMYALSRRGDRQAVRQVLVLVGGGFLLSYLGYLCWPTLPPYRYLVYDQALKGGPLFPFLHDWLDAGEALRQDCMPSGHTMMTVLTLIAAWRHDKRQLLWLSPIAFFLILGTVVLRYHWFVDLLAAIPFVLLALYLFSEKEPVQQAELS